MAELFTVSGDVVLLDDDDVPLLGGRRLYTHGRNHKQAKTTYAAIAIKGSNGKWRPILLHRFITGAPAGIRVDHRNRNGMDNRRENLRVATPSQNSGNALHEKEGRTSQYKGVHWGIRRNRWVAKIQVDTKTKMLGYFDDEVTAARAYDRAAVAAWGEFALINFPGQPLISVEDILAAKGETSRYNGVYWSKRERVWYARIGQGGGKQRKIGRFRDEEMAARAYDRALVECGGNSAFLNFPGEPLISDEDLTPIVTQTSSQYRGVSFATGAGRWTVGIRDGQKSRWVGYFDDEVVAARAYDLAAIEAGLPCLLNFPDGTSVEWLSETRALMAADKAARRGSSMYRGVSWRKQESMWRADIQINRRPLRLGLFASEEDAARACDKALVDSLGLAAARKRLNFPGDYESS